MSHKYFTINERNKLEVLLKENYTISKISKILNRHRATIYREIKRISGEYSSENAQENANIKAANKGRNSKIVTKLENKETVKYIMADGDFIWMSIRKILMKIIRLLNLGDLYIRVN